MKWFGVARAYAALCGLVQDTLHVKPPGFGAIVDRLGEDRELIVQGLKLHFDHRVSRCYGRLLAGEWNQPGTHHFLREMLNRVPGALSAVDVGSYIGELALELARHPRVRSVIAFEPRTLCAEACRSSAALNGFAHLVVVNAALGDAAGMQPPVRDLRAPGGAAPGLPGQAGEPVRVSTLDREMTGRGESTVVRIGVEGEGLRVLRGARKFIARARPLIIFEYNRLTRRHFRLDELASVLGDGYAIHRVRADGHLDGNLRRTWNCVAVPADSPFTPAARTLRID